jgi:hypothetical protein
MLTLHSVNTRLITRLSFDVDALVQPLMAARALLDVSNVIINSDLDGVWIDRLIAQTDAALSAACAEARPLPVLLRGSFGATAGALVLVHSFR